MRSIYLWQRIISPHMTGLVTALARKGHEVVYVAEQAMSLDRARQGWQPPDLANARLELAPTRRAVHALVNEAAPDSIHVCQGLRSNGVIKAAQKALAERGLRQWVVMETVEDAGWLGVIKRLEYRRLFRQWRAELQGVLATGWRTPEWVVARGMPWERVFPFAYFLPTPALQQHVDSQSWVRFRFLFVGQLIERKRVDLLIEAMGLLGREDFELIVIGEGPCGPYWRALAEGTLPGRVRWSGLVPMNTVPALMAQADCLVLPSRHDGWGAVVSEALMAGTPVICSDACGSAGVVRASKVGGVFASGDRDALARRLREVLDVRPLTYQARYELAQWARSLGAEAGAAYLLAVLEFVEGDGDRPMPPWQAEFRDERDSAGASP